MKCPKCKSKLRVTNSYEAGPAGNTKRLFCDECLTTVTAATILLQIDPVYGQGARSLAHKMKNGKLKVMAKEEKDNRD